MSIFSFVSGDGHVRSVAASGRLWRSEGEDRAAGPLTQVTALSVATGRRKTPHMGDKGL